MPTAKGPSPLLATEDLFRQVLARDRQTSSASPETNSGAWGEDVHFSNDSNEAFGYRGNAGDDGSDHSGSRMDVLAESFETVTLHDMLETGRPEGLNAGASGRGAGGAARHNGEPVRRATTASPEVALQDLLRTVDSQTHESLAHPGNADDAGHGSDRAAFTIVDNGTGGDDAGRSQAAARRGGRAEGPGGTQTLSLGATVDLSTFADRHSATTNKKHAMRQSDAEDGNFGSTFTLRDFKGLDLGSTADFSAHDAHAASRPPHEQQRAGASGGNCPDARQEEAANSDSNQKPTSATYTVSSSHTDNGDDGKASHPRRFHAAVHEVDSGERSRPEPQTSLFTFIPMDDNGKGSSGNQALSPRPPRSPRSARSARSAGRSPRSSPNPGRRSPRVKAGVVSEICASSLGVAPPTSPRTAPRSPRSPRHAPSDTAGSPRKPRGSPRSSPRMRLKFGGNDTFGALGSTAAGFSTSRPTPADTPSSANPDSSDGADLARILPQDAPTKALTFDGHGTSVVRAVAFSPLGDRVASGAKDGVILVWNATDSLDVYSLHGHSSDVFSVGWNPTGSRLVSGSEDCTAIIWDVELHAQLHVLQLHRSSVRGVAYTFNGTHVVTVSGDCTVGVWGEDGAQVSQLGPHKRPSGLRAVACSPVENKCVVGGDGKTAQVWDLAANSVVQSLEGHTNTILAVAYSRGGDRIVSGSKDCRAIVWDAASGAMLHELAGHRSAVYAVAFTCLGDGVISGSADETAKLWSTTSTEPLVTLEAHAGQVLGVSFSPLGDKLATSVSHGKVVVWDSKFSLAATRLKDALLLGSTGLLLDRCGLRSIPQNVLDLPSNKNWTCVDLSDNSLTDVAPLVQMLQKLPAVTDVRLKGNPIEPAHVRAICEASPNCYGDLVKHFSGYTDLHLFAAMGDDESLEALLEPGLPSSELDAKTGKGDTALTLAAAGGFLCCVKLLLVAGASVNAKDGHGQTPVAVALDAKAAHVLEALAASGLADLCGRDSTGRTPAMQAIGNSDADSLAVLAAAQREGYAVDLSSPNDAGDTPVVAALKRRSPAMVRVLLDLEHGVDVSTPDRAGAPPLVVAVCAKDAASVRLLISVGARIDATDRGGNTAAQLAIASKEPEIISSLASHRRGGADFALPAACLDGLTPWAAFLAAVQEDPSLRTAGPAMAGVVLVPTLGLDDTTIVEVNQEYLKDALASNPGWVRDASDRAILCFQGAQPAELEAHAAQTHKLLEQGLDKQGRQRRQSAKAGGSDVDEAEPLSEKLKVIKDYLRDYVWSPLQFCSEDVARSVAMNNFRAAALLPAVELLRTHVEQTAASTMENADKYREVIEYLSREDRTIYEQQFSKSKKGEGGRHYQALMVRIAELTQEFEDQQRPPARQPTADPLDLTVHVRFKTPAFVKRASGVAAAAAAAVVARGEHDKVEIFFREHTKAVYRIVEKGMLKHSSASGGGGGAPELDCSQVLDVGGCLINCSTFASMIQVVDQIFEYDRLGKWTICRMKNRWATPSAGGWRDCMINVLIEGVVFEIQVVLSALLDARSVLKGHAAYGKVRCFTELLMQAGLKPSAPSPHSESQQLVTILTEQLERKEHGVTNLAAENSALKGEVEKQREELSKLKAMLASGAVIPTPLLASLKRRASTGEPVEMSQSI